MAPPFDGIPPTDDAAPGDELGFDELDNEEDVYWADLKGADFASALEDKVQAFFNSLKRRGFMSLWRMQYAQYYSKDLGGLGGAMGSHAIQSAGEDGESLTFRLNEARSIITQGIQITIGERASFKCLATNDDYDSTSQVEVCDQLVDYTYRETHAERKEREVFEGEANFGVTFGWARWDHEAGDEVTYKKSIPVNPADPSMGEVQVPTTSQSGAPTVTVLYPWENIREPNAKEHLWSCARERRSKYELAAQWPEYAEKIRAMQGLDEYTTERLFGLDNDDGDTDDVIVQHFYHARCTVMPQGRYAVLVGDIILIDGPSPIAKGLPIIEMCSERYIGTSLGYAAAWMLNAPQQMYDQMLCDTASNISTYGRQTIAIVGGTEFNLEALANGNRALMLPAGAEMPQPMLFAQMPDAVKYMLEFILRRMEGISGVNGVTRGDPASNITSGTMAALFHEIAVEYMGSRQVARDFYREEMANLLLDLMRANAQGGFVAQIVGESDRPYMKQFEMTQIAGVRKVIVKTKNPMLGTVDGRMKLMGGVSGIQNPKDRRAAVNLILTGDIDQFIDDDQSETNCIKWENKQLALGVTVPVLQIDDHKAHYLAHKAELNKRREVFITDYQREQAAIQMSMDPATGQPVPMSPQTPTGAAMRAFLDHIAGHANTYMSMNPIYAEWMEMMPPPMYRGMPAPPSKPGNLAPEGAMGAAGSSGGSSVSIGSGASKPVQDAGADVPQPAEPAQSPSGPAGDQGETA
jgi:hypothetical protein